MRLFCPIPHRMRSHAVHISAVYCICMFGCHCVCRESGAQRRAGASPQRVPRQRMCTVKERSRRLSDRRQGDAPFERFKSVKHLSSVYVVNRFSRIKIIKEDPRRFVLPYGSMSRALPPRGYRTRSREPSKGRSSLPALRSKAARAEPKRRTAHAGSRPGSSLSMKERHYNGIIFYGK